MLVNYGMPGRIYSFFDNPNNFAEILVMLLPLVFALLIVSKNWRVKVLSLAALAVGVVSLGPPCPAPAGSALRWRRWSFWP